MSRFCPKKRREAAGESQDEQIFETSGFLFVLFLVLLVLFF